MRRLILALELVLAGVTASAASEVYRYEARPTGTDPDARGERARVVVARDGEGFRYRSVGTLADGTPRRVEIVTGADGALVEATERLGTGKTVRSVRVGHGGRVRWEERGPDGVREKSWDVPTDLTVAADASVALLARGVACGEASAGREVWFVDFSGHTIQGSLRPLPADRLDLPVGTFEVCPVDFILRVLLFRPRVHLWLARDPPRFLVRQIGKRSALGPRWHTVLTGTGDDP